MFPLINSLLSVILITGARPSFAAAGQAGSFLRQEPTARGAALGAALTALVDDSSAIYWNPALLGRMIKPDVTGTHVTLFEDTSYDFIASGLTSRWGSFAAGYVRQTSGGFEQRAGPSDAPTTFSITQSALMAGWGYAFAVPGLSGALPWFSDPKPLGLGVTIKQARESIGSISASGNGADAGLALHPNEQWAFGLSIQNLVAPSLTFVSAPVSYARAVDAAAEWTPALHGEWRPTLALHLANVQGDGLSASGGVEVVYHRLLAMRVGMQDKGLSTGVGVKIGNTSFDYAASIQDLGLSHVITLTQRFGQTREELEETIRRGIETLSTEDAARLAKAYQRKAEREIDDGKISDGLHDLESAALLDPTNDAIHERIREVSAQWEEQLKKQMLDRTAALAQQQYEQGNLLAARQYWKSVLEQDAGNAVARERLEAIDRSLSQQERSRLDELRADQAKNEAAQALAVAQGYLESGHLRQAKLEAEKGLKLHADDEALAKFLSGLNSQIAAFASKHAGDAEQLIAAKDYPGALREIEGGLREDPGNHRLVELSATVRGQLAQKVTPEQKKQVEQLYYRAVEEYLKGDYATAGKLADEVLSLDPGSESGKALKEKVDAAMRLTK